MAPAFTSWPHERLKFPQHSEAGRRRYRTDPVALGSPVAYEFRDIDVHTRRRDPVIERKLAERRFLELANAAPRARGVAWPKAQGGDARMGACINVFARSAVNCHARPQNQREDDLAWIE